MSIGRARRTTVAVTADPPHQTERQVKHAIRIALGRERDLMLFVNSTGVASYEPASGSAGYRVPYGLGRGGSDLIGCLSPSGRMVCLEVKSRTGRLRPDQATWLALLRRFGAFCAAVRSVEEAQAALGRARAGESE